MTAPEILAYCATWGVELWVENGDLRCIGPTAILERVAPPMRRVKPELIQLVQDERAAEVSRNGLSPLELWRSRGYVLYLETIQKDGQPWQTLGFDAPYVEDSDLSREALLKDAILIAQALDAEAGGFDIGTMPTAEQLAVIAIIERERRGGLWLVNTASLRGCWRRLQDLTGLKLSSRHLGVFVQLAKENPDLESGELLELYRAGLQPDEGKHIVESPLWFEPSLLCSDTEANARTWSVAQRECIEGQRRRAA